MLPSVLDLLPEAVFLVRNLRCGQCERVGCVGAVVFVCVLPRPLTHFQLPPFDLSNVLQPRHFWIVAALGSPGRALPFCIFAWLLLRSNEGVSYVNQCLPSTAFFAFIVHQK